MNMMEKIKDLKHIRNNKLKTLISQNNIKDNPLTHKELVTFFADVNQSSSDNCIKDYMESNCITELTYLTLDGLIFKIKRS